MDIDLRQETGIKPYFRYVLFLHSVVCSAYVYIHVNLVLKDTLAGKEESQPGNTRALVALGNSLR